jgi:hypothetical protein
MHVVGWPLPDADVARMQSMRSRVAMFFSAGMFWEISTDTAPV